MSPPGVSDHLACNDAHPNLVEILKRQLKRFNSVLWSRTGRDGAAPDRRAPPADVMYREFAAVRFVLRSRTQKKSCRALDDLTTRTSCIKIGQKCWHLSTSWILMFDRPNRHENFCCKVRWERPCPEEERSLSHLIVRSEKCSCTDEPWRQGWTNYREMQFSPGNAARSK